MYISLYTYIYIYIRVSLSLSPYIYIYTHTMSYSNSYYVISCYVIYRIISYCTLLLASELLVIREVVDLAPITRATITITITTLSLFLLPL